MIRVVAVLCVVCTASPARAQENSTAFSVERFTRPPGSDVILATDEPHTLAHLAASFGLVTSLLSTPMQLERVGVGDDVLATPVERRFGADLLAAIGLGSRYQLGFALPIVLHQRGDRLQGIGFEETELEPTVLGDLRLHAKLRISGDPGRFGMAAGVAGTLTLPTGNGEHFAGEAGRVMALQLLAGWRDRWWRAAVNLGARFRSQDVVLFTPSRPHTNELTVSLGVAGTVPRVADERVELTAELAKVIGDCRNKSAGDCVVRGYSPAEVRVGARGRVAPDWTVYAAYGFGITPDEVGSPAWRIVTGVGWHAMFAP